MGPPLLKKVVFPYYQRIRFLLSQLVNMQSMGSIGYKYTPFLLHF